MALKGTAQTRRARSPRQVLNRGEGWFPLCFQSKEQYEDYNALMNSSSNPSDNLGTFCMDCTPQYKTEMLECGRCEHPETRFVLYKNHVEQEVEQIGVAENSRFWSKVQRGITIINWGQDGKNKQPSQG